MIGSRLGPYEITAKLGAGGMGEVFKARDARLGRTVAIKVLPRDVAADPDRRARFEREARAIAALQHPHICTLLDLGNDQGVEFLVMEFLDGESLGDRLKRGPLRLEQTLDFGAQIADALARAHQQGITHRDLKPANVMLTRSGVKLLDFGLAKIGGSSPFGHADLATAETHAAPDPTLTESGMLLGTLQYMAPEQVEGHLADARSDIFALGALLYEMTTGRRAFPGSSPAAVLAAVLSSEPRPLAELAPGTPKELERIVSVCLAKSPEQRWQSAHDVRLQLAAVPTTGETARRSPPSAKPKRVLWIGGALVLALAALFAGTRLGGHPRAERPIRFAVTPPPGQTFVSRFDALTLALSPDGSALAFIVDAPSTSRVSQRGRSSPSLWIRTLSDLEPHRVTGSEGAESLFWSPDGRSIGFFTANQLKRVVVDGGSPTPICDIPPGSRHAATWGKDAIVFASSFVGEIYKVSPDGGGKPEVIVRPDPSHDEARAMWPWFLPDGRRFLFVASLKDGSGLLKLGSLDGSSRVLSPVASRVEYFDPGYLVFAHEGALIAQRFDPTSGQRRGPLLPLAPTVHYFYTSKWAGFSVSRDGSLAHVPLGPVTHLAWFDRSGRALSEIRSQEVGNTLNVAISPDGKAALFDRTRPDLGTFDVWTLDLERQLETRLTSDPTTEFEPLWLPDGRHVIYSVAKEYLPRLVLRDLASGNEQPLLPGGRFQEAMGVTPDGQRLLLAQTDASGTFGLWIMPLSGERTPQPLNVSERDAEVARLSPDGKLIAFISSESDQLEAYLAPLETPRQRLRLSTDGATSLAWSRDGKELLFTSRDRRLMRVAIRSTRPLEVGAAETLFSVPGLGWTTFDVAADGRLLAAVQDSSDTYGPVSVAVQRPLPNEP